MYIHVQDMISFLSLLAATVLLLLLLITLNNIIFCFKIENGILEKNTNQKEVNCSNYWNITAQL